MMSKEIAEPPHALHKPHHTHMKFRHASQKRKRQIGFPKLGGVGGVGGTKQNNNHKNEAHGRSPLFTQTSAPCCRGQTVQEPPPGLRR